MSTPTSEIQDYTTGPPKRHHDFYHDSGDITIQVQNAIFKIHRFFLIKHSSVLRDMLTLPQDKEECDGTDQRPLIIPGDTAFDWECLLGTFYRKYLVTTMTYNGEECLGLLRMAHKYGMETLEGEVMTILEKDQTTAGYVDLMVAAQIINSGPHYQKALSGLRASEQALDLEQAKRIGMESTFAVFTGRSYKGAPKCRYCSSSYMNCHSCSRWQNVEN